MGGLRFNHGIERESEVEPPNQWISPESAQNSQFWILVDGSIRDRSEHCFVFLLHKQVVWRS